MDIHPTSTGRGGRVLPEKTPKPGDTIKHLLKCYQCGCTVVEDRDGIPVSGASDIEGGGGNSLVTTTVTISNDQSKLPIHLRGMDTFAATSRDVVEPIVSAYCPFCGSPNPRGLGDDRDFFSSVDLSNT